jgi:hypothetical protein
MRPEALLAGLPRLVRAGDEARWRGQFCVATAGVVAVFWACTWLVGEAVRPGPTALAAACVGLPTLLMASVASGRRLREGLSRSLPPPRASVFETLASSRDRRTRLSGVVLTGIIILLVFERFTGTGGVMAGLVVGLLAPLGVVDWREGRRWAAAEIRRESRIFVLMGPDALSPRLGHADLYEIPAPVRDRDRRSARTPAFDPFDPGI